MAEQKSAPLTQEQLVEKVVAEKLSSTFGAEIGLAIGAAIREALQGMLPAKKMSIGEYIRKHAKKVHLTPGREYYDNGFRVFEHLLTEDEIQVLNQIRRPGRYVNRRVEVIVHNEGSENEVVVIRYKNASIDDRLENSKAFTSFKDLCNKILAEQLVKEADEDVEVVTRRKTA